MASPPIPPSLEHLATRPFSFYPPVINVEHNEWLFRKATWSEILVVNCKSGAEIWISRRFVGEVSRVDDPVLIVGLNRELEYRGGAVWPCQRRVIEMPLAVGGTTASSTPVPERTSPAPIVGIRLESNDKRIFKLVGGTLTVAIVLYIVAVNLNRIGEFRQRTVVFNTRDQQYLDLSSRDDYLTVVQKLGTPASDRWQSESNTLQVRALGYPDRKYTVILMGSDRRAASYIGTMDDNWKPIHSVELRSGGTTSSLLRNLNRF
ncbi:MAG TPA: hypothetical protein VKU19_29005 [Bryobacteraceae bacterium]|nr:hypothetical protein [Bryobacteraceae bacterium]